VSSYRRTHYATDNYLVVSKLKILPVSKRAAQKLDMEEFNLKKLSELKVREQYQVKISNRLVALENLNDDVDIISAWEVLYRM
jgi:hypothetical protein